tara:strand:+ start:7103 stop:7543 length:441 start_codon:yes stop_codon:yes gene_type:complete
MKTFTILLTLLFSKAYASWGPIDLSKVVCSSDLIVLGEIISFEEDYLQVSFLKEKRSTIYRIAKVRVDKLIKGTHRAKELRFLTPSEKKSTGGFDHMLLRKKLNQKGIWFFNGRDRFSGEFLDYNHPDFPQSIEKSSEVISMLSKC